MNNPTLLCTWVRRFLCDHLITECNLAINTQRSYRDLFILLLPFLAKISRKPKEKLLITDLTVKRILLFLDHIEHDRNCTVQTRNVRLSTLSAFARYVGSRDPAHLQWAAGVRALKPKKAQPQPLSWLTAQQVQQLLQVPDQRKSRGRIEHAVLLFLYNTGARVSELINVRVRDLDIHDGSDRHAIVTLHGKGGKIRQCPLWPRTSAVLCELLCDKKLNDAVFISQRGSPYTRFGIYRLVERSAAAVPSLSQQNVTPHTIRHTCACHLLSAGIDLNTIRAWLGHVSMNTTNIYAQIDLQMKTKAMKLCEIEGLESAPSWKSGSDTMAFLKSL